MCLISVLVNATRAEGLTGQVAHLKLARIGVLTGLFVLWLRQHGQRVHCFCWVCVCVGGGGELSGRGTGSAWTSGQEGENERAKTVGGWGGGSGAKWTEPQKVGMMIMEEVKNVWRNWKRKWKENNGIIGFMIPLFWVFNIWGTVAFDLLLFCSFVVCSWLPKCLCYSAFMFGPLYTFIFVCLTKAVFILLIKSKCFLLTQFHNKTFYVLAFFVRQRLEMMCVWLLTTVGYRLSETRDMTIGVLYTYLLTSVSMKTHFISCLLFFYYRWRKSNHG